MEELLPLERPKENYIPDTPPDLTNVPEVYYDVETTGLEWWDPEHYIVGIAIRTCDGREYYLPIRHDGGGNLDEAQVKEWAKRELRGKKIYGANIKFDNHFTREWGVDLEEQGNELGDVQHYAALLDEFRKQFSLDSLSKEFLGKGKIDDINVKLMKAYHASEVEKYAKRDVQLTAELKQYFWPFLEEDELHTVRKLEERLIFPICEMEKNAVFLDSNLLFEWQKEIDKIISDIVFELSEIAGCKINPKSGDDMELLFSILKLQMPSVLTELTGRPSFAGSVLKGYDNEHVQKARKCIQLMDLRSKYIKPYAKDIIRTALPIIRFELHQLRGDDYGTISGRFSMANRNLQQVMSYSKQAERFGDQFIIRDLFKPIPGYRWLSADANQIEFRLYTHYAKPKKILAEYAKNVNISYHKEVHKIVEDLGVAIKYKQLKNLNFAKLYGAGIKKIAEMMGLRGEEGMDTARMFVRIYHELFPEANELNTRAQYYAKKRKYVKTLLGRRARFRSEKKVHAAVNRIIQGSAGDIMKEKIIELHNRRKETGMIMRLTVHDEIDGDIKDYESAKLVEDILNHQTFDLDVPILWDVKVADTWGQCDRIPEKTTLKEMFT